MNSEQKKRNFVRGIIIAVSAVLTAAAVLEGLILVLKRYIRVTVDSSGKILDGNCFDADDGDGEYIFAAIENDDIL